MQHTSREFERELKTLRERLLAMGGRAEQQIARAVESMFLEVIVALAVLFAVGAVVAVRRRELAPAGRDAPDTRVPPTTTSIMRRSRGSDESWISSDSGSLSPPSSTERSLATMVVRRSGRDGVSSTRRA